MEIINRTCIPEKLFVPLIELAAERVEANLSNVTIKLTPGRIFIRGVAYSAASMKLVLPVTRSGWAIYHKNEGMLFSRDIFLLFVHELKHVADFQNGYTDMVGSNPRNVASSERRAKECARLAVQESFDSEEILAALYPLSDWVQADILKKLVPDSHFLSCAA